MAALGNMETVNLTSSTLASDSPGSLGDDLDTTGSSSITETVSHQNISLVTTASTSSNTPTTVVRTTTAVASTLDDTSTTQVSTGETISSTNSTTLVDISTAEQTDVDINYSNPTSESQTSVSVAEVTASDSDWTTMDDSLTTTVVPAPWQPSTDEKSTTERSNRITDHSTTVYVETASTVTRSSSDVTSTSSQLPSTSTSSTQTDTPVLKTTVTSSSVTSHADVTKRTIASSGPTIVRDNATTTGLGSISVDSQTTTQAPAADTTQSGAFPLSSNLWLGVGLGIGALLIVIIVILIVCCCRKRRCRRRNSQYDEDFIKEYEIVYNPSRKPYRRSLEKGNTNENLAPKRANYFEEGLRTGVENPNYHFVPDKGSDNILRNNKSNNIRGLEAESRFSIGPVLLDDEGISSTGETYDKMYTTHNTFRRGDQAPKMAAT